jgi:hypothetical protein
MLQTNFRFGGGTIGRASGRALSIFSYRTAIVDFLSRFRGGRKSRQAHKTARMAQEQQSPASDRFEAGGYAFFP